MLRNPTVGQLVRNVRKSKGGVGGGRDRGFGGKMVLLVLQECWQLNNQQRWSHKSQKLCGQPTEDPSKERPRSFWLIAQHWIPHCLKQQFRCCFTWCTVGSEDADLGRSPTESELSDAWQDPGVENSNNMVIFSHNHQIQMSCQHIQIQNTNFHTHPVSSPVSFAPCQCWKSSTSCQYWTPPPTIRFALQHTR